MFYHSVDDVLTEVNRVAQLPDMEEMRISCIRHIRDVYKKVGVSEINVYYSQNFDVEHGSVVLPMHMYRLLDVLKNPANGSKDIYCYEGMYDYSGTQFSKINRLGFRRDGHKLRIADTSIESVTLVYESIPINEDGEILIDDAIFSAVVAYCNFQELLVKSSNTKQERSTLNPTAFYKREANALINEAKAYLNRESWAKWRTFALHQSKFVRSPYQQGHYANNHQ